MSKVTSMLKDEDMSMIKKDNTTNHSGKKNIFKKKKKHFHVKILKK